MTQTLLVMTSLGLFFVLYLGLMFFCLLFIGFAFFICPWERGNWIFVKMACVLLSLPMGILFIYMLKNLFKFQTASKPDEIEIFEDEHPKLFEFIHQAATTSRARTRPRSTSITT